MLNFEIIVQLKCKKHYRQACMDARSTFDTGYIVSYVISYTVWVDI